MIKTNQKTTENRGSLSVVVFWLTTIVVTIYLFFEWLFLVTMPSYLDRLSTFNKFFVLIYVISFFLTSNILLFSPIFIVEKFFPNRKLFRISTKAYILIPTLTLTSLILILIDNFTYTMFRFGIINSSGILRALYALGFVGVAIVLYRRVDSFVVRRNKDWHRTKLSTRKVWVGLLAILVILAVTLPLTSESSDLSSNNLLDKSAISRPNIFLLTADGLNAQRMSVYGYDRNTTPFLKTISDQLLVMENNFTNSGNTTGSIISILTGKYPVNTRVLYPPDILNDKDAYQHLPGILQSMGYYNAQFSLGYYVDAYDLNVRDGFDEVNGRNADNAGILWRYLPTNYSHFIMHIINRLSARLMHIFFIKNMENPYVQVTTKPEDSDDAEKLTKTFDLLDQKEGPFFIHLHWLGTHGEKFFPTKQVFSTGKDLTNQEPWDPDLYDDSIIDFDRAIETLYRGLQTRNILQESIIIIGSDHGSKWSVIDRVPLIFIFPRGEFAERKPENSQNIDIAPTILDYMWVDKPGWMEGISLLDDINFYRPIISVSVGNTVVDSATGEYTYENTEPPFYQFGSSTIFFCSKWYNLNLETLVWSEGKLSPYISSCDSQEEFNVSYALTQIIDHFKRYNFDTSFLELLK